MDFFGMGIGELLLILIVVLIIWGPGKLPEIARTVGKTLGTLKKTTSDLTAELTKEIDREEKDNLSHPKNKDDKTEESPDVSQ